MKRFQFPLDRVRRWRVEQADVEALKLRQLGDRMSGLSREKVRIEMQRSQSERDVLGQASIQATEVQHLETYRRHTLNKIREIEDRERQCAQEIREQRKRFIEARQKAELLERLKHNALEEWQAASDREEENLAAELFLAKRSRR
jgi:flagellar export protein FliJ